MIRKFIRPLANQIHASLQDFGNRRITSEFYSRLGKITEYESFPAVGTRTLLDAHFFNPGYWYRLQLFRAALGSTAGEELSFVWKHNVSRCRDAARQLGISRVASLHEKLDSTIRIDAKRILGKLRSADDILSLQLPHGIPAGFLYDVILKRQQAPTVDVTDPLVEKDLQEFLVATRRSEELLSTFAPDAIGLSHAITSQCVPLGWLGALAKIPVIVLFGNYGLPHFWRVRSPDDVSTGVDSPTASDLESLSPEKAEALFRVGKEYLEARFGGRTSDIGGAMAFSSSTDAAADIARSLFNSDDKRPTVAVYASNWFDFPHATGMSRFRDFLDWMMATLDVAIRTSSVRWLFRGHPVDKWYGGMTLRDAMPAELPEHVVLTPDNWSGAEVMAKADALVTYHGTAGIEYASIGKPVLVADRGWYHDRGFVRVAESREHYLELLRTDWFKDWDAEKARRLATIFAGWYFCGPDWQAHQSLPDDSDKDAVRKALIERNDAETQHVRATEIATIRRWYQSGSFGYHTYKMANANGYALSNVGS